MQEPNPLIRWVMFHFAGGDALFVALLALVLISFVRERPADAWRWTWLTLLAAIWGGLTSPAWPAAALVGFAGLIVGWRLVVHFQRRFGSWTNRLATILRVACLIAAGGERLATASFSKLTPPTSLCVIADSLTAGLNDGEATWPRHFVEGTSTTVRDASQPGATLRSALRQADLLDDDESPLILEIGGNDLLSGLPVAAFREQLESLCRRVCRGRRPVWMLELPLPPLCSRYGWEQRRLCRQHGVRLIGKRKLMNLLTTSGATVDSVHLSEHGQELFCALIQHELSAGERVGEGDYLKCEPRRLTRSATSE